MRRRRPAPRRETAFQPMTRSQAPGLGEDRPRDKCGVFGVFGHPRAAAITLKGLYALQHRGQESAGIVSSDGTTFYEHRGMGLVGTVFGNGAVSRLLGDIAIGHNRYSTAGSSSLANAQPFVVQYQRGPLAIAHNGNFVNAFRIRRELEAHGQVFTTSSDTEVFAHLVGKSRSLMLEERVVDALKEIRGAYSLLGMGKNVMIAVRDPSGFRPLWLGSFEGATVLASETCALDAVEADVDREVEPGELLVITEHGANSIPLPLYEKRSHCIFELLYLARIDSALFGESVAECRERFGRQLAREAAIDADIVIPMPDSSNVTALGYSQESGVPFRFGIARNPYIGRTFITPNQQERDFNVDVKINPVRSVVRGQRVVLVDDSLMRGTTMRKIVKKIRLAGALEVHVRIAAPPTRFPCFYGVDIPTRHELIASSHTVEEVCRHIRADSLGYLSVEGMLSAVGAPSSFCTACFDGNYPVEFSGQNVQQLSIDFTRGRDR